MVLFFLPQAYFGMLTVFMAQVILPAQVVSSANTQELPQTSSSVVFEMIWEPTLGSRGYAALGKFIQLRRHHV